MTTFKAKLTTAIATGSVLFQAVAPVALAANTVEISGNGAGSDNVASVTQTSSTTVNQSNTAYVTNNVESDADTGDNSANFNTGGSVTVDTGGVEVDATVTNNLNSNAAAVDCCAAGDTDVLIEGNGSFSDTTAGVRTENTTTVNQGNYANVTNDIDVEAETGENDANSNTGDGDVVIRTGKATVNTDVTTSANSNVAEVGSNDDNDSDVSLRILDNGAGSDNVISAYLSNETTLNQNNTAYVTNEVEVDAETGENDANFNTGDGDVVIDTGNAELDVAIDNAVNFNAADVDCGCVYGLTAKIAGNGSDDLLEDEDSDADNRITANLSGEQLFGQGNLANMTNDLAGSQGVEADTGDNEASVNTSGSDTDPSVNTGDAAVNTTVENSGNENVLGDLDLSDVDFSWDFDGMMSFFGMMFHS